MVFFPWNCTSTSLDCSSIFQMFLGLISYPMVVLAWWVELFWFLFVHPHRSSALSDRKQGRFVNECKKSVPRSIRRIFFSKNKVPIYAYAVQLNKFTSYRLTGWYASVLGGQIFDNDGVDSLGVMAQSSWHTHLIFSTPYNYVVRRLPIPLIH